MCYHNVVDDIRIHFGSSFKMARNKCLICKKTGPPANPHGRICHPEVAKRQPAVKRQRVEPDPESGSSSDFQLRLQLDFVLTGCGGAGAGDAALGSPADRVGGPPASEGEP